MRVRKRDGSWHVDFRYRCPTTGESKRFRRSTGDGTTKAEAERLGEQWRLEMETPPAPPAPPAPKLKRAAFSGFARHWNDTYAKVNWKPSTQREVERTLRLHLVPFFGDADLRAVEPEEVERYKASKVGAVKPKTINNHLSILSSLFNSAVEWRYCESNPVQRVAWMAVPEPGFQFWDQEQSSAFLVAVADRENEWFAFFATLLLTGVRLGEALALEWGDVDFVRRELHVRRNWTEGQLTTPKSGHGRRIPMPGNLVEILRAHRHMRSDLVFSRDDGTHMSGDMCWKPMKRCIRAAGLPDLSAHDLRHSYASQLVMAGVPLKAVQEYLGHADIKTTMRYAHLGPDARAEYVQVLDGAPDSRSRSGHTRKGG